jgi:hypothetical protein
MRVDPKRIIQFLGCACVAAFLIYGCSGFLGPDKSRVAAGVAEKDDPYPAECQIIRKYLKARYGEVEIETWGTRSVFDSQFGGHISLGAWFCIKGRHDTTFGSFVIGAGGALESASLFND